MPFRYIVILSFVWRYFVFSSFSSWPHAITPGETTIYNAIAKWHKPATIQKRVIVFVYCTFPCPDKSTNEIDTSYSFCVMIRTNLRQTDRTRRTDDRKDGRMDGWTDRQSGGYMLSRWEHYKLPQVTEMQYHMMASFWLISDVTWRWRTANEQSSSDSLGQITWVSFKKS